MRAQENKLTYFDYVYFFVMLVYMAQMDPGTRFYTFSFARPLPTLIPLVFSVVLAVRHKVSLLDKKLGITILACSLWFLVYIIKINTFGGQVLPWRVSYLGVIIIYSFLHIKVYREKLPYLYERFMVLLSVVSLFFYTFQCISPGAAASFFSLFPDTGESGNNVLFIYKYMNVATTDYYHGLVRNSGCSWEPGRFSIMIVLALLFHIYRYGKIKVNRSFMILNIALITTLSTTGILTALVMYFFAYFRKLSLPRIIGSIIIFIPIFYFVYQQEFIYSKLDTQYSIFQDIDRYSYYLGFRDSDEESLAIDRIPSLMLEFQNLLHDFFVGYGDWANSYFATNVTETARTCGGLIQVLSTYGIFLGVLFYIVLWKSSCVFSKQYMFENKYLFLIVIVLSSISYPVFGVMLFTSFWFYGVYNNEKK